MIIFINILLSLDLNIHVSTPELLTAYLAYALAWVRSLFFPDGPKNMAVTVSPAMVLANGTSFVTKGSNVIFTCSSTSYPSQNLTWTFETVEENITRTSGSKSSLFFEIFNIQPEDQRNYTCLAENTISKKAETRRMELLVYCMAYKLLHYISVRWELYEHYSNVILVLLVLNENYTNIVIRWERCDVIRMLYKCYVSIRWQWWMLYERCISVRWELYEC